MVYFLWKKNDSAIATGLGMFAAATDDHLRLRNEGTARLAVSWSDLCVAGVVS